MSGAAVAALFIAEQKRQRDVYQQEKRRYNEQQEKEAQEKAQREKCSRCYNLDNCKGREFCVRKDR